NPFRRTGLGAWALIACLAIAQDARAQARGGQPASPSRRPFARPGTPRKPERLRFVDVQHIKAELTLDAKKREVGGTVIHTVKPLHPFLKAVELDCGKDLHVKRATVDPDRTPCTFRQDGDTLKIELDRPRGPDAAIELAIEYAGSPDRGL